MTDKTPGTALAFPTSSDAQQWDAETSALMDSAGLVHRDRDGTETPAPRSVVASFLHQCARTQLDPHARQIYLIARKTKGTLVWTTQVSIDGFRLIAERSGHYAGQGDVEWLTPDGKWVDVWLPKYGAHPEGARATVYRDDFAQPMRAIALWDSYVQTTYNGEVTSMWKQHGPGQIAKCAEALALRKAFPMDLSALYTVDEMQQAEQDHDGVYVTTRMQRDSRTEPGYGKGNGHASETEVLTRPEKNSTRPGVARPGRPRTDPVAGTADRTREAAHAKANEYREKHDVAAQWVTRVHATTDMDQLIRLHDEAAQMPLVLDYDLDGSTVEQWFLGQRAKLQQAAAGEPEPTMHLDHVDVDDPELDGLPF